tara:strand:+ start:538 stop:816 length:279 start_codon:yes stop_codon:yes gene_type:complete
MSPSPWRADEATAPILNALSSALVQVASSATLASDAARPRVSSAVERCEVLTGAIVGAVAPLPTGCLLVITLSHASLSLWIDLWDTLELSFH